MPDGMRPSLSSEKERVTEKDLKRRSTFDQLNIFFHRSHMGDERESKREGERQKEKEKEKDAQSQDILSDSKSLAKRAASFDVPRRRLTLRHSRDEHDHSHTPAIQPSYSKADRFSMFRWRNQSESQLSTMAKEHAVRASDIPPIPAMPTDISSRRRQQTQTMRADDTPLAAPSIIMTAPAIKNSEKPMLQRSKSRLFYPFSRQKPTTAPEVASPPSARPSLDERKSLDKRSRAESRKSRFGTFGRARDPAEELRRLAGIRMTVDGQGASHSFDHSSNSAVLTFPRESISARSDGGERPVAPSGSTLTSPERPRPFHTNSTFSFLTGRNKQRASLFPLPDRMPPSDVSPRPSTNSIISHGSPDVSSARSSPLKPAQSSSTTLNGLEGIPIHYPSFSALAGSSLNFAAPAGSLLRTQSVKSAQSSASSPAIISPIVIKDRKRSSTLGSASVRSDGAPPPTPPFANGTGRDSTSTAGRSSSQNLFNLTRLRHSSDPNSPRGSSGHGMSTPAYGSHTNSLHLNRESYHLPEREEAETAIQFLERVDDSVPKPQIPCLLADKENEFHQAVMRSFMRKFTFFGDPLDMALRKLLMEVDLPNEAQQIDRVLQSFADRYHECNPGIFTNAERAYFVAFSLILLHSDFFNKNNKKKMLKAEYVKNTSSEGIDVSGDVLECFYDNIIYTPFIRVEDDLETKNMSSRKSKRVPKVLKSAMPDPVRKPSKEPLDPYTYILEGNFDDLRPPLKGVLALEDPYSYLGTAARLDKNLLKSTKCGIIQLESARSRPDAFMSPSGIKNPNEAKVGVVDLPVDKVGVLWRKDPKKKTARSPWQEWGAILTGAGIYFFKNSGFVKSYMHQYEHHRKHGHASAPCIFTPAVTTWKADYMLPTDNSVALLDTTYKKHKHAFIFFRHNNADETFLADNEYEMNDWLARLNHQAAFKTAGIRQRGLVGGHYDGQRQRGMRRLESSNSTTTLQTVQTPTGEVTIQSGKIDHELAQQISTARRKNMQCKILQAEEKLAESIKQLDDQLRDARHLLLLAPIHERTRNNVLHSASRASVQLDWTRIEIWRMKCHRDILAMDLEEETSEAHRRQNRIDRLAGKEPKATSIKSESTTSTAKPKPNGIERLNSNATTSTARTARAPLSPISIRRPDTQYSAPSDTSSAESGSSDVFQTPPETIIESTPMNSPNSTKLSGIAGHRGSFASTATTMLSPRLGPQTSALDDPPDSPSLSEYRTPMMSDAEAENQREGGPLAHLDGSAVDHASTATQNGPDHEFENVSDHVSTSAGSPDSRNKVRRSFRGTLRESNSRDSPNSNHKHRRGIKGDSTSSAILDEDAIASPTDLEPGAGLKREKGSFTVHGKKASVVTFGGDWASINAEERLRALARTESNPQASPVSPAPLENDIRVAQGLQIPARTTSSSMTGQSTITYPKSGSASFGGGSALHLDKMEDLVNGSKLDHPKTGTDGDKKQKEEAGSSISTPQSNGRGEVKEEALLNGRQTSSLGKAEQVQRDAHASDASPSTSPSSSPSSHTVKQEHLSQFLDVKA